MIITDLQKKVEEENKNLFKKIRKTHASELLSGYSFPRGKDHIIVDEFNNILNFCSQDYSLVENKRILNPIEKKLTQANVDFHRKVTMNESEFHVSYLLKSAKQKVLGDIFPVLKITNSYNGQIKFRHEFGYVRLVCLNGLTRPHGSTIIEVSKHSTELNETSLVFLIRDIMDETNEFIKESKKDIETFEKLNSVKVTKELIAQVSKQLKFNDKIVSTATERFEYETSEKKESFTYVDLNGNVQASPMADKSLFTLYNAINYAIYHNSPKEPVDIKQKKDSLLLEAVEKRLN